MRPLSTLTQAPNLNTPTNFCIDSCLIHSHLNHRYLAFGVFAQFSRFGPAGCLSRRLDMRMKAVLKLIQGTLERSTNPKSNPARFIYLPFITFIYSVKPVKYEIGVQNVQNTIHIYTHNLSLSLQKVSFHHNSCSISSINSCQLCRTGLKKKSEIL